MLTPLFVFLGLRLEKIVHSQSLKSPIPKKESENPLNDWCQTPCQRKRNIYICSLTQSDRLSGIIPDMIGPVPGSQFTVSLYSTALKKIDHVPAMPE